VTLVTFGKKSTEKKISYIELQNVAVTVIVDDESQLICSIFHDVSDGQEFGLLVAQQVVSKFIHEFGRKFTISDVPKYKNLTTKMPELFKNAVNPLLTKLSKVRGIKSAYLIVGSQSANFTSTTTDLSMTANLRVLTSACTDLSIFL